MNTRVHVHYGRGSLRSLFILFGLAFLSWGAFAAPPNPPVFTALDNRDLGHPNPDGRYSLEDAVRGLPFTVNTPIPPQIEAEQVVTPSTLGSYINTPRMRLILESGNYGDRTFNSQDQQIVLREGVSFGRVSIGGSARRISIRNEVPRSGNMTSITLPEGGWGGFPEDILIDGIRSDNGGNRNFLNGQRIAVINSFIRSVDHPVSTFNGLYNDIIVANCNIEAYGAQQSGVRFHNANRLVFVDNRILKTGSHHHPFRLHGGVGANIEHAYIGRNQIGTPQAVSIIPDGVGNGGMGDIFENIWFEDNNLYVESSFSGAFLAVGATEPQIQILTVRRNAFYGPLSSIFGVGGGGPIPPFPAWVVEGNTMNNFQSPPPWNFR